MQAFIPHRDIQLILARTQRSFIDAYTERHGVLSVWPAFPLWAYAEELPTLYESCNIAEPCTDGHSWYFPVKIATSTAQQLRIVFATCPKGAAIEFAKEFKPEGFPLEVRVFKTGTAVCADNSWQLFDEQWHKLSAPEIHSEKPLSQSTV